MKSSLTFALLFAVALYSCRKDKAEEPLPKVDPQDSKFTVTGTFKDFGSTMFAGYYPQQMTLLKSSSGQGTVVPDELGIPGHIITATGSTNNKTFYAQFGIIITLDPTTNKITSITNHYGQPSPNGRSAMLDPSGVNAWNPATREIKIKFWMDEPAVFTPHRASFDETWTYIGPK